MLAQAALLKGERERETIGIAIDLADCAVGMSPACLPASPPPLSIGALMVVDPSGSNHHLAVAEQAGRPTEGEVSPLINHGRISRGSLNFSRCGKRLGV